jgi:exosortase
VELKELQQPNAESALPDRRLPQTALWGIAALLLAANFPVLQGLAKTWWISFAETGHGLVAVPLAFYIAWEKKDELKGLPIEGSNWGLILAVVCGLLVVVSSIAQWVFFSQIGALGTLIGAIWYLFGPNYLRTLAFPLFLLGLSIPPPSFLYTRITFELQLLASRLGELGLELLGFSVLREGNILQLVGERLSVAEACSGVRSLVTLLFFFVVYGYFLIQSKWVRWTLPLMVIPVAIFTNALRIISTGVLAQYNRELAHGITHEISGYITLVLGGGICILLAQFLEKTRGSKGEIAA